MAERLEFLVVSISQMMSGNFVAILSAKPCLNVIDEEKKPATITTEHDFIAHKNTYLCNFHVATQAFV